MRKALPWIVAVAMVVVGGVWTFQGLGFLEGSPMTGVSFWAIAGPVVAGFGLALMLVLRDRR
jgi:TRAP-type C4-dicarboxylate transport system permease small subunit